ncbi:MAG: hypothetical protein V3T72_05485 [Thermoanaerobaculia bacterium]
MSSDRHLRRALEALSAAVQERLARHPQGHLLQASRDEIELSLSVPLASADGLRDKVSRESVDKAEAALNDELDAAISRRTAFRPGHVFCLRCSSADCEHSAPPSSRQIFAGYGPSGVPGFLDFGQWLLERKHPRVDRLYRRPPELVTDIASGRELSGDLLAAFRDREHDYRIHGQVTAGWFPMRAGDVLALTFQVLSSAIRKGRRKGQRQLSLNVLGAGPDGEPLEELYDRLPRIPWTSPVSWSQPVLRSIERSQGRKSSTPELLSKRVEGVLASIARQFDHDHRSRGRRTVHAQKRHAEGDRPTRLALRDLADAADGDFFFDQRKRTFIVLGERGRAHVWSPAGKLVTSIRYSADSIERKKNNEIWRPAKEEEIAGLRKTVGVDDAAPSP